jgi:hypothetical protein
MADESRLSQLLPARFLLAIRDRIKAGVSDAEAKFRFNQDEEDALTGALAQAISTSEPLAFKSNEGNFKFSIESFKLRGRGEGAPEKRLGADGILQICVFKNGKLDFEKGLPFQAKKRGGFGNAAVTKQARSLVDTSGTGIIVRFSPEGYTAVDARTLLDPKENSQITVSPPVIRLATMLGDLFLDCEVGRMGLSFKRDAIDDLYRGAWVINALVHAQLG